MDTTAGGIINTLISPQAGDCVYIDCELAASNGSGTLIDWVNADGTFYTNVEPDLYCTFSSGSFYRSTNVGYSDVGVDRREYLLYSSGGLIDGTITFPTLSAEDMARRYSLLGEGFHNYSPMSGSGAWAYSQFLGYIYRIIFFPLGSGENRMDLIPAQQNSSGKQGLYDVANSRFYAFLKFNFLKKNGTFTYSVASSLTVRYQTYNSYVGYSDIITKTVAKGSSSLGDSSLGGIASISYATISPVSDTTYYYAPTAGISIYSE